MILAYLIAAAAPMQCTPADYLCTLGRSPTYSEQEPGRMAAQRLEAERALIDRQAASVRAASNSQAEATRALPRRVEDLSAAGRCSEAADVALNGGDINLAQQTRTYCR
ncbi:hypothetical protein [Sphingomonas phyllosphaerae]|uniref:hypothetical protein n=1 Tax=Sphingomonas phyllosphaerae TaxID=257003 RepID=UPI0003B4AB81|nr:hypothetical protein [Sphingomonas phyllosphaerae]